MKPECKHDGYIKLEIDKEFLVGSPFALCTKCGFEFNNVAWLSNRRFQDGVQAERERTEKVDKILLDVVLQALGNENGMIDNRCMSAYEEATFYLADKGLIKKVNDRMFQEIQEGGK